MFSTVIFCLLLGSPGVIAVQITLSQIYNVEYAEGSGIIHDALTVAGNIDKINQKSWSATIKAMIPNLAKAINATVALENVAINYIAAFEQPNKNGVKTIFIPNKIGNMIINSVNNIIKIFQNIGNSNLPQTVKNNEISLESVNGNVILESSTANHFDSILTYMASQFGKLKTNIDFLATGLIDLTNFIAENATYSYQPYLFKLGAIETKKMATRIGFVGKEIEDLLQMFKAATIVASNGLTILSANNITTAISITVQKIAFNFDRIAEDGQLILNGLTSLPKNIIKNILDSNAQSKASNSAPNVQTPTNQLSPTPNGMGNTAYTSTMLNELGYAEMLSDIANAVADLIKDYKTKLLNN